MLQCVAVCCGVLHCGVVCHVGLCCKCVTLYSVAVCCGVLQLVAVYGIMLQCVTLDYVASVTR